MQRSRKGISFFVLLTFITNSILLSFTQDACSGFCSLDMDSKCECSMEQNSCCDLIEKNSNDGSPSFNLEITHKSCNHDYFIDELNISLVPKISDLKVDLNKITEINIGTDNNTNRIFYSNKNLLWDAGPPIYLKVSSFLI